MTRTKRTFSSSTSGKAPSGKAPRFAPESKSGAGGSARTERTSSEEEEQRELVAPSESKVRKRTKMSPRTDAEQMPIDQLRAAKVIKRVVRGHWGRKEYAVVKREAKFSTLPPPNMDALDWLQREQEQETREDDWVAAAINFVDKAKAAQAHTTAEENEHVDKEWGSPCQATMDAAKKEHPQDHHMRRASANNLWTTVETTRQRHHPDMDRFVFGRRHSEKILRQALKTYLPELETRDMEKFIDQALKNEDEEDEPSTWLTYRGKRVMTHEKFTTWWNSNVEKGSAKREAFSDDDSSEEDETTSGEGGSGGDVKPERK